MRGEKPLEQSKNQQQTQPTYGTKLEKPGPHLCAIPVPVDSLCSDWLYLFIVSYKQAYNHECRAGFQPGFKKWLYKMRYRAYSNGQFLSQNNILKKKM